MIWSKKLYFDEVTKEWSKDIVKRLKRRKWSPGTYIITLSSNQSNLLDIYECSQLMQPSMKKLKLTVVGVAFGRDSALELVRTIIDDVYHETDGFAVKEYFGF